MRFTALSQVLKGVRAQLFLRSVAMLAGSSAVAQALLLLILPVLTRLYSPIDFSVLAIFTSILGIVASVACMRFEIAIPLPEKDSEGIHLLALALISTCVVALLTWVGLLFFGAEIVLLLKRRELDQVIWLLPAAVFFYGLYAAIQFWSTRAKDFREISSTRIKQAVAGSGLQLGLGVMGAGAIGLVIGQIVSGSAGFIFLSRRLIKLHFDDVRKVTVASLVVVCRKYKRFPQYSVVEALANSVSMLAPILVIAATVPGGEAGQLALAIKVVMAPMALIGAAVSQVFTSGISKHISENNLSLVIADTISRVAGIFFGPFMLLLLVAPILFPVLFGGEWKRAGTLAAWLAPVVFLQLTVSPVSMALHASGNQIAAMKIQLAGLVVRVGTVSYVAVVDPSWVSETFAMSGLIFYAGYLLAILRICNVCVDDIASVWVRWRVWLISWTALMSGIGVLIRLFFGFQGIV